MYRKGEAGGKATNEMTSREKHSSESSALSARAQSPPDRELKFFCSHVTVFTEKKNLSCFFKSGLSYIISQLAVISKSVTVQPSCLAKTSIDFPVISVVEALRVIHGTKFKDYSNYSSSPR